MKTFLTDAKLSKKFQQYGLAARVLERSCSLWMEDLPPQADKDLLHLYWENQRVQLKSVVMIPEENAAVFTLLKPEGSFYVVTYITSLRQHMPCASLHSLSIYYIVYLIVWEIS